MGEEGFLLPFRCESSLPFAFGQAEKNETVVSGGEAAAAASDGVGPPLLPSCAARGED